MPVECSGLTRAAEPGVHPCCSPIDLGHLRPGGPRRAGALMAVAARESVTVAG